MFLNDASLLHNLRCRYEMDKIYTYTGYILIAINPYKNLPIYDDARMFEYKGKSIGSLPPHVFAIGDHVEALLGWFIYMSSRPGFEFEERVHDIIDMLNQALFSAWVLGTFFPSDR